MIDGVVSDVFSMSTFPLTDTESIDEKINKIRIQSRQRYARPREELEKFISEWAMKTFDKVEKAMEKVQDVVKQS